MTIAFRKVSEPHGWLGNMAPYPIVHEGAEYRTTEALFQCLRFDDTEIRDKIREQKSPMGAKLAAKSNRQQMVVEQLGEQDLDNMRLALRLKVEQHTELKDKLLETGDELIVEDVTSRQRGSGMFWGAALQDDETWSGENWLGKLWMELRDDINKTI